MKKLVSVLLLTFLFSSSCQKVGKQAVVDQWLEYRKAYALLSVNRDSAFLHFNRLAENSKDKQQIALAYYNMALMQSYSGDHYGAQESLTMSFKSLDENRAQDRPYLATDFNELAMTSFNLQEYTATLNYSQRALTYTSDPELLQYIFTNQGNAYQKLKKYDEAISSYRQVIRLSGGKGVNYARALTSLTITKWLKDPDYNAAHDLHIALAIRLKENDTWGQNSSYAHLSDFYADLHPDSALYYAKKMLIVARRLQSADDELEALQKLALFADSTAVRPYFLRYQMVSDSLTAARRAAKNQFAMIRYGVEKSKADNLRLQKDNVEKQFQLGGVLAFMVAGTAAGIFWYRKRGERLKLEKEREIQETQLRLSKKVHDVVANGIYRVMNEMEYSEKLDKTHLLNQLESMYEQSRDITYEKEEPLPGNFAQNITRLLNAFKNTAVKLAVTGNEPFVWNVVNMKIKHELLPVLQELMVNMTKHSQASQALVSFEIKAGTLVVTYRDNGVGIAPDINFGNGLRNTENRIEGLGGKFTFATNANDGTRIQLIIPIT